MASTPHPRLNKTIKIVLKQIYKLLSASASFSEILCPICASSVKYHSKYQKWLYHERISIIRVKCSNPHCGTTHALIPEFSVPGCSIATAELEKFIRLRLHGVSVDTAGQCFVNAGMSPDYPEEIHKRMKKYFHRIEAVFRPSKRFINYQEIIMTLAHVKNDPILSINLQSIDHRCNPVLFSRINILFFQENIIDRDISLNPPCSRSP